MRFGKDILKEQRKTASGQKQKRKGFSPMMKKALTALFSALIILSQLSAQEKDPANEKDNRQWLEETFKGTLTNAAGEEVPVSSLKGKMVGVYFSASWCGPCRAFTPQLVKFHKETAQENELEIVFVSCDKSEKDMMAYMKKDSMPFLAVPFDSATRSELKSKLKISGIPTLIIYGKDGKLITRQARADVVKLGKDAVKAWNSPDYKPLASPSAADSKNTDKKSQSASSSSSGKDKKKTTVKRSKVTKKSSGKYSKYSKNKKKK